MIKRIIDVSEKSYLHTRQSQLIIERKGEEVGSVPVEDLGILILEHPAIIISQKAVIACQQQGAAVVFCDDRRLPYSITLPVADGHSLHSKVIKAQIAATQPTKKRLWKQVIQHKIRYQQQTLQTFNKASKSLERLAETVKSGDSENHEAQAAQRYWRLLMGDDFRRDRDAGGINALLNYGYAVIRAMVARALVGSGLHPALGLHHRNQYNGLCLADDLMEPFRPWVDRIVYRLAAQQSDPAIDRSSKTPFLQLPGMNVRWRDKTMPLMVACHYLAANLKEALSDNEKSLTYPEWAVQEP